LGTLAQLDKLSDEKAELEEENNRVLGELRSVSQYNLGIF
jgi:hypothetical protein